MRYALFMLLLFSSAFVQAALPAGISFVGFDGNSWNLYVTRSDAKGHVELRQLKTVSEPREPSICEHADIAVYVDAAGALRRRGLSGDRDQVIAEAKPGTGYTQPTFSPDCSDVIVVSMRQGKSVDTDIVRIPLQGGAPSVLLEQPGAQFDPTPYEMGTLVYTHVHCVLDCGRPVVKEVWLRSGSDGAPRRISHDEAVAHHPIIHDGHIYFSYNKADYFHVWRTDLKGDGLTQMTFGEQVTDLNPSIAADGELYFLRSVAGETRLMRQVAAGVEAVDFQIPLMRLRDMRAVIP